MTYFSLISLALSHQQIGLDSYVKTIHLDRLKMLFIIVIMVTISQEWIYNSSKLKMYSSFPVVTRKSYMN